MQVIEPQFQRDFISFLPKEVTISRLSLGYRIEWFSLLSRASVEITIWLNRFCICFTSFPLHWRQWSICCFKEVKGLCIIWLYFVTHTPVLHHTDIVNAKGGQFAKLEHFVQQLVSSPHSSKSATLICCHPLLVHCSCSCCSYHWKTVILTFANCPDYI